MKVTTWPDKCVAAGQCAAMAPHTFDQRDDDGVVVLLEEHPTEDQYEDVRQAAAACPALAIDYQE